MIRIQELIYRVKPDYLIETGIAHGGSLVFYAGLFKAIASGRVIGVDIDIRPHNRKALENHQLYDLITLVEGSSTDQGTLEKVRNHIHSDEKGLVILDSNHTRGHVLSELQAYSEFVAPNSYIIVCDGIMQELASAPRTSPDWVIDNPQTAIKDFLADRNDFALEEPVFPFNEGNINERVTYWPNAYLRRIK
jgi:cephalosporin hydroxylase